MSIYSSNGPCFDWRSPSFRRFKPKIKDTCFQVYILVGETFRAYVKLCGCKFLQQLTACFWASRWSCSDQSFAPWTGFVCVTKNTPQPQVCAEKYSWWTPPKKAIWHSMSHNTTLLPTCSKRGAWCSNTCQTITIPMGASILSGSTRIGNCHGDLSLGISGDLNPLLPFPPAPNIYM